MSNEQKEWWTIRLPIGKKEKNPQPHIGGFKMKETIFLPPSNFLDNLSSYFHEAGRIIGETMSFSDGSVLLPDEAKIAKLPLNFQERLRILKHIVGKQDKAMDSFEESVASKILHLYTKGNYPLDRIKLINLNHVQFQKFLEHLAKDQEPNDVYEVDKQGNLFPKSTDRGFLIELPAYAVEIAGMTILSNSFSSADFKFKVIEGKTEGSHDRALSEVLVAYKETGRILPSALDYQRFTEHHQIHR
ncbi:hypothetical protein A3A76_06040 [Candidatus Woesebacteria bacterium RIFCSPLOWO2_01_FULL_39_23]|uniref:Uncharacterized protein n=1 Tax=Candidatus Woesebacteria bacterium RIFCSPHIGHO2_01_FULL_40_22 TaxID=1802499 RepID=A0A1F7YI63_9BACT|nr:MAG: hypothetical protein A2141_02735 [Candidatus Woesebacteria bacterium RBG_16_40_11]OGM26962.1 MAG: hypothetical protein A2628_05980 [Candidatus Woesebacteria bacterium RIFCSPHIGHO2_01_FULL_40_22]OGM37369.1 MAG: hypothetical protein A3E41_04385 [Candidatus Woesebacteria bacterium RIFCSPHIGHO2_12_FULL_38_9]OGM63237.1 MAG: hypothetical protein A3A76_06040 [Candidatus Woesebacteria bacterium RIFCSPLOWO2_01_FULL_39_23]